MLRICAQLMAFSFASWGCQTASGVGSETSSFAGTGISGTHDTSSVGMTGSMDAGDAELGGTSARLLYRGEVPVVRVLTQPNHLLVVTQSQLRRFAADGTVQWQWEAPRQIDRVLSWAGGTIIVDAAMILDVDLESGALTPRRPLIDRCVAATIVDDDRVLCLSAPDWTLHLRSYALDTGLVTEREFGPASALEDHELWGVPGRREFISLAEGLAFHLYALDDAGLPIAINRAKGAVQGPSLVFDTRPAHRVLDARGSLFVIRGSGCSAADVPTDAGCFAEDGELWPDETVEILAMTGEGQIVGIARGSDPNSCTRGPDAVVGGCAVFAFDFARRSLSMARVRSPLLAEYVSAGYDETSGTFVFGGRATNPTTPGEISVHEVWALDVPSPFVGR